MSPADIQSALTSMLGGQRRRLVVNGHKVALVCTVVGERHVIIDKRVFRSWESGFVGKVAKALA